MQGAENVVIPVVHELRTGDIDDVTASALAAAEVQESMCNGRVTRRTIVSEPSATDIAHAVMVVRRRLHANADNRGHFAQAEFVQYKESVRLITLRGGNYDGESSGNGLAAANVGQVSMTQRGALGSTPVAARQQLPVDQPSTREPDGSPTDAALSEAEAEELVDEASRESQDQHFSRADPPAEAVPTVTPAGETRQSSAASAHRSPTYPSPARRGRPGLPAPGPDQPRVTKYFPQASSTCKT